MIKRTFILLLLIFAIMPFALAHEGEQIEAHSFLSRTLDNQTVHGGAAVLVLIALAGYFVVKKRRTHSRQQTRKQEVHASEKIMTGFIIAVIGIAILALAFTAKSI